MPGPRRPTQVFGLPLPRKERRYRKRTPQAQALHYKTDASKVDKAKDPSIAAGQTCSSCQLYQGKPSDTAGPCQLFQNKLV